MSDSPLLDSHIIDAVHSYLETAGWLVSDSELATEEERERGYEGDHRHGPFDLESQAHALVAVATFIEASDPQDIIDYLAKPGIGWEQLGHDLWLTRNGHGAGFWDRGLGALGERLTETAKAMSEAYSFVDLNEYVHID